MLTVTHWHSLKTIQTHQAAHLAPRFVSLTSPVLPDLSASRVLLHCLQILQMHDHVSSQGASGTTTSLLCRGQSSAAASAEHCS